jgi:hypothetical protein
VLLTLLLVPFLGVLLEVVIMGLLPFLSLEPAVLVEILPVVQKSFSSLLPCLISLILVSPFLESALFGRTVRIVIAVFVEVSARIRFIVKGVILLIFIFVMNSVETCCLGALLVALGLVKMRPLGALGRLLLLSVMAGFVVVGRFVPPFLAVVLLLSLVVVLGLRPLVVLLHGLVPGGALLAVALLVGVRVGRAAAFGEVGGVGDGHGDWHGGGAVQKHQFTRAGLLLLELTQTLPRIIIIPERRRLQRDGVEGVGMGLQPVRVEGVDSQGRLRLVFLQR